jgi:DNA (cytosine-5)-methyltransferase 1
MENVVGAPLVEPVLICGSMFDPPMDVRRHRLFETNWPLRDPDWPCRHKLWAKRFPAEHRKTRGGLARVVGVYGGGRYAGSDALRKRAMGIDWMTREELTQAIPPPYTEWIGGELLAHLRPHAGAAT